MSTREEQRVRPDNVTVIAIYHFVVGALALIGAAGLLVLALLLIGVTGLYEAFLIWSLIGISVGMAIVGGLGVVSLVVGFGLLKLRPWARWAAVVLAVLGLSRFPVGTVIGVLILIYLLGDEGRQAFEVEQ